MRLSLVIACSFVCGCPSAQPIDVPPPEQTVPGEDDAPEATLADRVEELQRATYVVLAVSDLSFITATAFAVGPRLLATNAHVVEGIIDILGEPGAQVVAVRHQSGAVVSLVTGWTHPAYDGSSPFLTPDVGLFETIEILPTALTVPHWSFAPVVRILDTVTLCGFPGSVTVGIDIVGFFAGADFRPQATCLQGNVSALRTFEETVRPDAPIAQLIQYDISTESGLSGSAVLDAQGDLIGVHAFGVSQEAEQNLAVRVDFLSGLMDWAEDDVVHGTDLFAIETRVIEPDCAPICRAVDDCDSDCDGWWDDVETAVGTDPCNDDSPPFPPDVAAGICDSLGDPVVGEVLCLTNCRAFGLCDSDCDGWYDRVEQEVGSDHCSPTSPPFSPEPGNAAGICDAFTVYDTNVTACPRICLYGECDSDCDGWFDSTEETIGADPCNASSPPFAPSFPALVCPIDGAPKSRTVDSDAQFKHYHRMATKFQTVELMGKPFPVRPGDYEPAP